MDGLNIRLKKTCCLRFYRTLYDQVILLFYFIHKKKIKILYNTIKDFIRTINLYLNLYLIQVLSVPHHSYFLLCACWEQCLVWIHHNGKLSGFTTPPETMKFKTMKFIDSEPGKGQENLSICMNNNQSSFL